MRKKAGGALPEAVVEQVYDRAGGVPLFVEEFTKMVQESGVLDQAGEGDAAARPAGARDPRHAPGSGDGPPGPHGGRAGGGPARRDARPRVQLRAARRRRDRGRADAPGRAGQAGAGGDPVPEGPAAPLHLHLQARPARRRPVQRAGQGQAAAVPPADRRGAGSAVPADRRDAAGAARPPLHRGGPDREGGRLLAQGGAAVAGAVGGHRSDRPSDQGPGAARARSTSRPSATPGNWSC